MTQTNHRHSRRRFLRRKKRRPLKSISLLPSLVTLFNGIFGFAAITLASSPDKTDIGSFSRFSIAGYLVVFAMIADMLDGRQAPMSQTTSSFGGQLDSLCDMVSFGVAPAFISLQILQHHMSGTELLHSDLISRSLWLTAITYISCAAIRLARFNVENVEKESGHMSFEGLPSPAAAGVLVSFVIFHQEVVPQWTHLLWLLPLLMMGVAILMVGRIPYPHVVNHYLRGKKPFDYLIKTLLFLGLVAWGRQAALLLIFSSFAGSGVVRAGFQRLKHRTADTPSEHAHTEPSSSAMG
jgi:CDP-diacylglycerol--serine O-phosphatidyltransferase